MSRNPPKALGARRDGKYQGSKNVGKSYKHSQSNAERFATIPKEENEDDFKFEYNPGRVDMIKFTRAQRKLVTYVSTRYLDVSKIFTSGVEVTHDNPVPPNLNNNNDPHGFKKDQHREAVKLVMKAKYEYASNKKLAYGVLWGHCSETLQNTIRASEGFDVMETEQNVVTLWNKVKSLCTVGTLVRVDPDKRKREAQQRFEKIRQFTSENVTTFYDRYLQEYNAWKSAGNSFVCAFFQPGGDAAAQAQAQAQVETEINKATAMDFLTKLDYRRFGRLLDDLSNSMAMGDNKYPVNVAEAMECHICIWHIWT
jgi:hypothetical protein